MAPLRLRPPARRLRLPIRAGPFTVRRRADVVTAFPGPEAPVLLVTAALGYSGALEEDQARWIEGFRRLLDGLDRPLQLVVRFRPGQIGGPGESVAEPGALLPPPDQRREADLAFLRRLDTSPDAQAREVLITAPGAAADRIREALKAFGLVPEVRELDTSAGVVHIEHADHALIAGRLRRCWYLQRFPGVELEPGWLHRLAPPATDVTIACHVRPLPTAWMIEHLQRRLTSLRAAHLEETATGRADPELAGALPTIQELQRQLVASQERAFQVAVYVELSAAGEERLAAGTEAIEAAARTLLCRLERCTLRTADAWVACRPWGLDPLQRDHVLHTSAATTLFPWFDSELREPDGLILGRSRATGCPVQLDPFDGRRPNANIGVFGHSGAGKTYLMSTLAMGAAGQGVQVLIIDPEHEYGRLADALGGVDVPLALGSGIALNVLDLRGEGGDRLQESWLGPAVADAVDLIAVICGGLDEAQRATVEAAVRRAYASTKEPVLADVAALLPGDSTAGRVLQRWVQGSLGAMFSAPTNIDLEAPIVVFGMRELREELVAPVHFLLAGALWSRIKTRSRRRLLFVDELGLLFEDPTIRRFVVNLARRIRKYDGGLVFATQNPGDLLASEAGSVVATNPSIHLFGSLRPGEATRVQRAFQLSDAQRSGLETARRGEFLLASGPDRVPLQVLAPPWQAALLERERAPPAFV